MAAAGKESGPVGTENGAQEASKMTDSFTLEGLLGFLHILTLYIGTLSVIFDQKILCFHVGKGETK